ncbi:CHAT domain-containing protein [Streptomyces avermitilis]|uniref:CHAT domain-containing protein n=1 Tax=Streptomyces avermitilis TaxID=33903 RepID=UPI0036ABBF97
MASAYFGEYNHIYFIEGANGLCGIRDRAHRGSTVTFAEEPLEDLSPEPRAEQGPFTGQPVVSQIVMDGIHHQFPCGFGRGLTYSLQESKGPGHTSVRLVVSLPALTRYCVRWESTQRRGEVFMLTHGITLTVHTSLDWDYHDGFFTVETASADGEVVFVVDSQVPTTAVQDRIIVAARGHEREALGVRAVCGRGFVPSFVVSEEKWADPATLPGLLDGLACSVVIGVGLAAPADEPRFVAADPDTGAWPGSPLLEATLTAPDWPDAHGPALHLAIQYGARLILDSAAGPCLRLADADGTVLEQWHLADLVGVPMPGPQGGRELVVCESTPQDLLVCHAVGYADACAHPVAFLPPVDAGSGFTQAAGDATDLVRRAARAVPASLRRPDTHVITVFTRDLPLHLTPVSDTDPGLGHWMDRYTLAHLPGRTAAVLVPRFLRGLTERAADAPIGVVFDALEACASTEGEIYARQLAEGLTHPLVLAGPRARRKVLQEVLHRIETDLVLIIAHGEGDHFDDHDNDEISSKLIKTWKLRGRPLVFNNSCSSWTTSGEAFITAGAKAVIATLWPVGNDDAAAIGGRFGELLHTLPETSAPDLLAAAIRQAPKHGFETAAAYVYVGLPAVTPLATPVIDDHETLELLATTFDALFGCLEQLLAEGDTATALALQPVVTASLRRRFAALVRPGAMPLHLPSPRAQFTTLDATCLLGLTNLAFGRRLLRALPTAHQRPVLEQMRDLAWGVLRELLEWEERHDHHRGRPFTEAEQAASTLPLTTLGEGGFYQLGSTFALMDLLPLADSLLQVHAPELHQDALTMYELAAKLVTVPSDLEADGSVTDEALIRRIRTGNPEHHRAVWGRDGNAGRETTIDLLAQAVKDKGELANRFGTIRLRLQEYDAAIALFEAACELATDDSPVAVNAASNLATARGLRGDRTAAAEHDEAIVRQLAADDVNNALVTAANLLRQAALSNRRVDDVFLAQVLPLTERIASPVLRTAHRAAILGALSVYHAALGDHGRAAAVCAMLVPLLSQSQREPARHVQALAQWYYLHDDHARGVAQGLYTARALDRARLPEEAVLAYLQAANCALMAHGGRGPKRYLRRFLECVQRLGHLTRAHPDVAHRFEEWLGDAVDNTRGLWRQFQGLGLRRLALLAYEAQKTWPDGEVHESWEALSHAFHARNVAIIRELAAHDLLHRGAIVQIGPDLHVTVSTVTHRSGDPSADSPTVYATMPLHSTGRAAGTDNVRQVGRGVVFRLGPGEHATVEENGVEAIVTDGRDAVYRGLWGSRIFTYGLTISVAADVDVTDVRCFRIAGAEPAVRTVGGPNGTLIKVTAARPWLATVCVAVRRPNV